MAERGESRAIYTVITDDPDFQDLSPYAKLVWYTLNMTLGVSGIAVAASSELAARTGIDADKIAPAIEELRRGRWLIVEKNVFWLRNGLAFDPYVSAKHDKQRAGLLKHLRGLPKLGIVNSYADYYGMELPFQGKAFKRLTKGFAIGSRIGSGIGSPKGAEAGERNQESGIRRKDSSVDKSTGAGAPTSFPQSGGQQPLHNQFMPLLRDLNFVADDSDGSILKALTEKKVSRTDIDQAVRGLALLRNRGGLVDALGVKPADPLNMRMLYQRSVGKMPLWRDAEDEYFRWEKTSVTKGNGMAQLGDVLQDALSAAGKES